MTAQTSRLLPDGAPSLQPNNLLQRSDIERALTEGLCLTHRGRQRLILQGPLSVSAFSQVYRAEGGGFPSPVAVKQFVRDHLGASAAEAAARYFLALKQVSAIAHDAEMSASEPFILLERYGIVVSSWIDGPTLSKGLFQKSSDERRKMLGHAGVWLAHLHHATSLGRRVPEIARAIVRLEAELAESDHRSSPLLLNALAVLRSAAKAFEGRRVPWSRVHGDFKPTNLIVDGDRLAGIDFDLAVQAPNIHDAAHFLNHLQMQFYTWRGLPRWLGMGQLTESFVQGYASVAGEELDTALLTWQRLYNVCHLMLIHRTWSNPAKAVLVDLALKHQLKVLRDSLVHLRQYHADRL